MIEDVLSHWPFMVVALIFAMVGQVVKGTVFTADNIRGARGIVRRLLWWGRKTLPLHPVIAGALLGLIPGLPVSPGVPEGAAASSLYFAGAGVCSTWIFDITRGLLKNQGVELGEAGPDSCPPLASSRPPGAA